MFNLLTTYQDDWFGDNPRTDLFNHYSMDNDGFGFLKLILTEHHPNLRKTSKSETMDKPRIQEYKTWFAFMKQYRKWVEFEARSRTKRTYTKEEHVSNVLQQIRDIECFALAKEYIEQKMLKVDEDILKFPEDLELHKIGVTVFDMMPESARKILPTYSQPHPNIINKFTRKFNDKSSDKSPKAEVLPSKVYRGWEDVKCPSCGQVGHHIDQHGCDHMAVALNIDQYKRTHRQNFDKSTVLEKFNKYQEAIRARKTSSKKKRNLLRQGLRAAKLELHNDEETYKQLKAYTIKSFKLEYPDDDLNDPRQDHLHEIREYDILDSESESESEE